MSAQLLHERTEHRPPERTRSERHEVVGDQLLAELKELVRQGSVRRTILVNDEGETLLEVPRTLGLVGAGLMPVWVAVGAVAALALVAAWPPRGVGG
jgi:hypothetical protein